MGKETITYYTTNISKRRYNSIEEITEKYSTIHADEIQITKHVETTQTQKINKNAFGITREEKEDFLYSILASLIDKLKIIFKEKLLTVSNVNPYNTPLFQIDINSKKTKQYIKSVINNL